ncbi:N-acetylglucosaminyl-diphospho-decaprenol L-rhamnosyltransferase [Pseudonocardia hierapolitana]|uniref:N-acetylglucosaminyl-diphospho-decaprenol L-rhamnosyltransferase n=1 Tax=Pseudonocardia hierapolitana TaxID=1128676 RepID=A0A561SUN5_9PSEU|nr:glycosyltransferase family 2 protein [Pseudonocardia hierapolitana]TWF78573.1 N-acetylglucosaminyl-diphospho-decaprenol L-rhamnosyltransferase [Pseudonocardia hierapolitana]
MLSDPVRAYGDRLAVVTVTRRGRPSVDGLRASLPAGTRLVVVGTASCARDEDVVRLPEDVGWAAAVNRGVAGLEPDVGWVVLADPGLRWRPGAIDTLLAAAVRCPRAGLLGPALHGVPGPAGGPVPGLLDAARGRIASGTGAGPTGWLSTAGALVRRAAWDSVDGFDGRYLDGPGGIGDVDLGDRLGRAGWLVVFVPNAEADAEPGDTFVERHGILEPHAAGLHRYVRDRARGPARALAALARRAPDLKP